MKKTYQKPNVVEVTLVSEEILTADEEFADVETGVESSIF